MATGSGPITAPMTSSTEDSLRLYVGRDGPRAGRARVVAGLTVASPESQNLGSIHLRMAPHPRP